MLDLSKHWPNIPPKSDISDWLALGHSREDLDALIAKAEDWDSDYGLGEWNAGHSAACCSATPSVASSSAR
jgi:hypothetical protein